MVIVVKNNIFLLICGVVLVLKYDMVALENIKLDEKTSCDVEPPVIDFTLDVHPFYIFVSWVQLPPNECEIKYVVYLNDSKYGEIPENSINIIDLNACSDYKIAVSVFYNLTEGEKTTKSGRTTVPEPFSIYSIQSPNVQDTEKGFKIDWSMNETVKNCVNYYVIDYWIENGSKITNETTDMWYEFNSIVRCNKYLILIRPEISPSQSGKYSYISKIANLKPTKPPKCKVKTSQKTSVDVVCKTDSFAVNMCEIKSIILICQAPVESNGNFSWIIQPPPKIERVSDSETRPDITVTVDNLSEFTNYTCTGILTNSGGNSSVSEAISFQTLKEVPSSPTDMKIIERTLESFKIVWKEPNKIPGPLTKYRVKIENEGPQHYVKDECKNLTGADQLLDANIYTYTFDTFPNYLYSVSVNAINGAGEGEKATLELITDTGTPEPPLNLTKVSYIDFSIESYKATVQIDWQLPCNTNGPLKGFIVNIIWNREEKEQSSGSIVDYVIKNKDSTNIDYSYNITNIQNLSNYEITIITILDSGIGSEQAKLNFTSPVGYPGPPTLIKIENVAETNFTAYWEEPEVTWGIIIGYRVIVKAIGPKYDVLDSTCNYPHDEQKFDVPSDKLQFIFNKAWPDYEYSVYVQAKTDAGFGNSSKELRNITKTAKPESIRNPQLSHNHFETEFYNDTTLISFEPPCKVNGNFKFYKLQYMAKRTNYPDHNKDFYIINTTKIIRLKPDYKYDLNITVYNLDSLNSNTLNISWISNSGVPQVNQTALKAPEPNGTSKANFRFDNTIINPDQGDIIYYALYLSEKIFSTIKPRYGFWNESSGWPAKPSADAHQITAERWQPFGSGVSSINFVIGEEKNCSSSICNGELKNATTYYLILRGLTRNTYIDSDPLQFTTGIAIKNEFDLVLILCLVVGLSFL